MGRLAAGAAAAAFGDDVQGTAVGGYGRSDWKHRYCTGGD
jgi:hypothetical protein